MTYITLRRTSFLRAITAFAVATAMTLPAAAAEALNTDPILPTAAVGETNGGPVHFRFPLSKFTPTPGPLRLIDASTGANISVPFSARLKPRSVVLNLTFTSSIALHPETSVMSVRFNETTLAQIRLDPKSPVVTARVNVPVELVRPGYNVLTLATTQHIGDDCEDPEAPELWTEVNTVESNLEIDGEYDSRAISLADIDQVFSPGIGAARRLAIVTPPLKTDAATIEAGSLVAQAVALRTQYEAVDLKPATIGGAFSGTEAWLRDDQALIGTREQLAGVLSADESARIVGPYLSMRLLERRQVRLVVSGRTPQDVLVAARALTYMDVPVTDAISAAVRGIDRDSSARARTLQPDRIYGFTELGVPTTTLAGSGTQRVTLNLPMPPDFYAPEQAAVDLLLDLNYGAGTGIGSVVNVEVNGKFVHAINLNQEAGSAYRGYRISVPLRDFVGGTNQIGFAVIMRPVRKDRCAGASGRHLAFTLSGTSSVTLPEASFVAAQPDLDLMVRTGFPYSYASATPTNVWVPDESLLGAAWTFTGRLAQVSGGALPHQQFSIGGEPPRGSAIIFAEAKTLPPRLFANAVQALGEVNRMPYRGFDAPRGVETPSLFDRLWPLGEAKKLPDRPVPVGSVSQANDLGENLVLTAVRAEGSGLATTTVVTAANRERLIAGVQQLVAPQYWGRANGDFMLWKDNKPDSVVTLRLSPRYQSDSSPALMNLRFYVSQHPWWWLGGIIGILMALSGLTVWLLARRRPPSA